MSARLLMRMAVKMIALCLSAMTLVCCGASVSDHKPLTAQSITSGHDSIQSPKAAPTTAPSTPNMSVESERDPPSPDIALSIELAVNEQNYKKALTLVTDAMRMRPSHRPYFEWGTRIMAMNGRFQEAEALFTQLLKNSGEQEESRLHLMLAGIYWMQNKQAHMREAIEHGCEKSMNANRAQCLHLEALMEEKKGHLEKATEHYQEALKLAPLQIESRINLSLVLLAQQMVEQALQEARQALKEAPLSVSAALTVGRMLEEASQHEEAAQIYLGLIEHYPLQAEGCFRLAQLYLEKNLKGKSALERLVAAKALLEKLNALDESLAPARLSEVKAQLSKIDKQIENERRKKS